jgi:predicted HTH domain antitoxin
MQIDIPDDIVSRAEANVTDLLIAMAVTLYADNKLDHSDAARMCKLSPAKFSDELLARGMVVQQYPVEIPAIQRQTA